MGSFPLTIYGNYGWEKVTRTTQRQKLGTRMELPDGRVYYYALAAGAIGAGQVCMQLNHHSAGHLKDMPVQLSVPVGGTTITLAASKATIIKNLYQDGYMFVNDMGTGVSKGEGMVYVIKSQEAATGTTVTFTIVLDEEDGLQEEAFSSTETEVGLRINPWKDVATYDVSDIDGMVAGVTPVDVANNEYFWAQTWGTGAVLTAGTVVLGNQVTPCQSNITGGSSIDGAIQALPVLASHAATATKCIQPHVAGALVPVVGIVESVGASTEYSLIFLTVSR